LKRDGVPISACRAAWRHSLELIQREVLPLVGHLHNDPVAVAAE
jgi:hypothetical protein